MHGDTRTYETCHVVVRTPRGVFTAQAGIVPHLPIPLLIGRDCPIFQTVEPQTGLPTTAGPSTKSWTNWPTRLWGSASPLRPLSRQQRTTGPRGVSPPHRVLQATQRGDPLKQNPGGHPWTLRIP